MEFITKLESMVGGWVKNVPHLPPAGQKWLGQNVWWLVLISVIVSGITSLLAIGAIFTAIALLGAVSSTVYGAYAATGITGFYIVTLVVALAFGILRFVLLALAIKPLKAMQKKGWVLLFTVWLLGAVSAVVSSIMTLDVLGFIFGIIFGAIFLAIGAYFLFEIRGQFDRSAKPVTVKKSA